MDEENEYKRKIADTANHLSTGIKMIVKNKGTFIVVAPIIFWILVGIIAVGTGISSAAQVSHFLTYAWENVASGTGNYSGEDKQVWMENLGASELLDYIKTGKIEYDDTLYESMKMTKKTFIYMLELCSEYEKERDKVRDITIEYISEERVMVEKPVVIGTDKYGYLQYETVLVDTGKTEEVIRKKTITVSNSHIEYFKDMDWRMLYVFCLIRSNSYSADYTEETAGNTWMISKKDVKDTFELLETKLDYSYNVLTDKPFSNLFTLDECMNLPHTVEIICPDNESNIVKETYYIPASLLNQGYSGFSLINHTVKDGATYSIKEVYSEEQYQMLAAAMGDAYSEDALQLFCSQIPGAESKVYEKISYYRDRAQQDEAVIQEKECNIVIGDYSIVEGSLSDIFIPGSNTGTISPDGKVYYPSPKTPGEAAVNYAVKRAHWGYSKGKRMSEGWWDCSSLICRSYYDGAGIDIQRSGTTLTLKANAEKYGQIIQESELMPGDVWWFGDRMKDGSYANRHVVMYCGNGMAIQAYGDNYGTIYHSVDAMKASIKAKLQFCMRPYTGLEYRPGWENN